MPRLGQGWTNNPSQFCGIQEVTITPKGSQGCWPEVELQTPSFLPVLTLPSPRSSSCLGLWL